jgi:hypothetical protein
MPMETVVFLPFCFCLFYFESIEQHRPALCYIGMNNKKSPFLLLKEYRFFLDQGKGDHLHIMD